MKKLLFALCLLTVSGFLLQPSNALNRTPDRISNWFYFDSTSNIHLYYGGGMRYESMDIYIRYDSCIRVDMEQGMDRVTKFAMTPEMRTLVSNLMQKYQAMEINSKPLKGIIHDKATTKICINMEHKKHCFSSGASEQIVEKYAADFSKLWEKLEEFSLSDGKIKD